jgi:hypothetical protein
LKRKNKEKTMSVLLNPRAWQMIANRKSGKIALLSAFPNSFLPNEAGALTVQGISEEEVKAAMSSGADIVSYVGHDSTAALFNERISSNVATHRGEATLDDLIIIGSFTPPRRLANGEVWTEEEILAMPIKWLIIK